MRCTKSTIFGLLLIAVSAFAARAEVNVVASIKPVHSLVAAVMAGVGKPDLIIEGSGSPHTYALKPSQAAMLERADVVFWIGHELEAFLAKPLKTIAANAKSVELIETDDLVKLDLREGGPFDAHAHDDHAAHKTRRKKHHDHHRVKKSHHNHGHGHGGEKKARRDHDRDAFNPHVWLDPVNAKAMTRNIKDALTAVDPANAARYEANAKAVMARLTDLTADITAQLKPFRAKGFIVFHDAYQNFESRFGLKASGSITVSPEVRVGVRRIRALRSKIRELRATCVFSEPQFEPKIVATVVEGTPAKSGVLDPLGAALKGGPELYFKLLRNMATSFAACFSPSD
ncbi:MAG: zinc ABC transporter substrate-binding protein [Hyphomicrobiaceae bacterium]